VRLVVATNNPGKLQELAALLDADFEFVTMAEAGLQSPPETGATFEENALLKARAAHRPGCCSIADDSGLEVPALGNRPGVHSARFAGEPGDDARNNELLVTMLRDMRGDQRACRFVSVVAFIDADGNEHLARGEVNGEVTAEPRGTNGFGYDPYFRITDADATPFHGRTMAELTLDEKNLISHRARAYRAIAPVVESARTRNTSAPGGL
jgi:XTP/dITP diphosphohydrolase